MVTINLKDFFYWYISDEYIEVTEEVAAELRADRRYEATYQRTARRHKALDDLENDDRLEYAVSYGEPTPEALLERLETFYCLWNALNSLPPMQGRRVDAHIILEVSYHKIAKREGVYWTTVRCSVEDGLRAMKKFFEENF